MNELEDINGELTQLLKELAAHKELCQTIESDVATAQDELAKAKAKLASIVERRLAAEADVKDKSDIVDDLRKKLADAEKDLEDAKINLGDIKEEEKKMPAIIN